MVSPPSGAGRWPALHDVPSSEALSEREEQVLNLIAWGYSNKEIAARLRLSVKTVETYKTRSLEKLDLRGRTGVVRYAVRRGWLAEGGPFDPAFQPEPNGPCEHPVAGQSN